MLELVLSSFAGLAIATAVKKFPRTKNRPVSAVPSRHIQNQIGSLQTEKEILTKTISRLYQSDVNMSKTRRDMLLVKYQHRLGIVLAKIEKLEEAGRHPDLGPIGDGLITLMDQKLSMLDQRLHELSSRIAVADVQIKSEKEGIPETGREKKPVQKEIKKPAGVEMPRPAAPIREMPRTEQPIEIVTLTNIPSVPESPTIRQMAAESGTSRQEMEVAGTAVPQMQKPVMEDVTLPKAIPPDAARPASELPDEDGDEDDADDVDKIKGDIMKALSRLKEAEVE